MEFIGKNNKNGKKGHKYVQSFIKRSWNEDEHKYVNLDFDGLKRSKKFKYLLLREQGFRCCYCMHHLKGETTTIEHIIPRATKKDSEKEEYFNYGISSEMIVLEKDIVKTEKIKVPPYPHTIAYENLVASCDGKINPEQPNGIYCCNHIRKSKKIIPIFFLKDTMSIIIYEKDGKLTYDEKYKDTLEALNLEYTTLTLIRKAWAKLSSDYNLYHIKVAITDESLRIDIIDEMELEAKNKESETLRKEVYWKLFWEYRWFYSYFQK
jgi:5-methylcytosine-specific restriction endonuclease McrA